MIHDDEAESASNTYVLSLVLLMLGAPLPILNLLASVIFYLGARRSSPFVRWHCTQALLAQLVVIPVNSVFLWMTVSLLLGYREPDNFYIGWGIVMLGLNAAKWIGCIVTAIKVRRGKDVRWWALAPLADALQGRKPWGESIAGPLAGVLVLAGLFVAVTRIPWIETMGFEKAQDRLEARLDELIEKSLDRGDQQIREPALDATLRTIVDRICDANDLKCAGYRIHLLRDMEINAAALPAGHVIVNAGLVLASPDAEALTGVLAHELAHAERGDVRRTLLREIGLSVLMGASADTSQGVFRQMLSLSYDRDMEAEADRTAVDWLLKARVDPTPLGNFLATMADGGTTPLVALARTHPGSEQRALKILDRIPADHPAWVPVLASQQWDDFRDSVGRAMTKSD